jgi:hypothetical protein
LTEATLLPVSGSHEEGIFEFLAKVSGTQEGIARPPRFRTIKDHYWVFDRLWVYLCFLGLPLEVVVRRRLARRGFRPGLRVSAKSSDIVGSIKMKSS